MNDISEFKKDFYASEEQRSKFNLSKLLTDVYFNNPFLGTILTSIKIEESNTLETASISVDNILRYNINFIAGLSVSEFEFVISHECLHKQNNHFDRASNICLQRYGISWYDFIKMKDSSMELIQKVNAFMSISNIAMDCAINQLIKNIHGCSDRISKHFIFPENIERDYKDYITKPLLRMKEYEYYLEYIEDIFSRMPESEKLKILSHLSLHEISDIPEDADIPKTFYDDKFNEILEKAHSIEQDIKNKRGLGRGSISSLMCIEKAKVNDRLLWQSIIQQTFGAKRSMIPEYKYGIQSRRNENSIYGKIKPYEDTHNVVLIDTSGSCQSYIPKFFGVINLAIKRYNTVVDLYLCDTYCYDIIENVKRLEPSKIKLQTGGTDLRKAQERIIEKFKNKKINVIVLTDGDTPWQKWNYKTNVIYTPSHRKLPNVSKFAVIQ